MSSALPLEISIVDGRGVLTTSGRRLGAFGRVDHLEMEIPDLRFPFDVSAGTARFQHRRCRLRALTLSLGAADLRALVDTLPFEAYGLHDVEAELAGPFVRLGARAAMGPRESEVTALGAFRRTPTRGVRLSLFDVRVYGFLPAPPPLVAAAFFAALGAARTGEANGAEERIAGRGAPPWISGHAPSPLLRVVGPCDLEIDTLEIGLIGLLAPHGWRLPERANVKPVPVGVDRERLVLEYKPLAADDDDSGPLAMLQTSVGAPELWAHEEGRVEMADAEAALLEGDLGRALDLYRSALVQGQKPFVTNRLLQLLLGSNETLEEAEELASAVLARTPDSVPALLAKAVAAAEAGRVAEAAQIYERLADLAVAAKSPLDEAGALVAAARLKLEAGASAAGEALLERALRARARHKGAARLLGAHLRATGRFEELLKLFRQRAADEPTPAARAALLVEGGLVLLNHIGDHDRARDRFEQAVRLDQDAAAAWEGLGRVEALAGRREAAAAALERARALFAAADERVAEARVEVALADIDEVESRVDEALARLGRAAALDPANVEALRAAGDLAFRSGRADEAVQSLEQALARATRAADACRVLRRLAAVKLQGFGDRPGARLLLERALAEGPADAEVLDDLGALLKAAGETEELEPFLRRAVAAAAGRDERAALLERLADLGRQLHSRTLVNEALLDLAADGGTAGARAALELGEQAVSRGDEETLQAAATALEAVLAAPPEPAARLPRSELALRAAAVRERMGDEDAALQWLRALLEGDAEGEVASRAWRMFVDIALRRGDAAAATQALEAWADDARAGESPRARADHLREAARIFRERLGFLADAASALDHAVALDPSDGAAFEELALVLEELGDDARLAAALRARLEAAPGDVATATRLGDICATRLGREDEALELYRKALAHDPHDVRAHLGLARLLWNAGSKQDAARHYEELIAPVDPPVAEADVRAEAHLRLGQWARVVGNAGDADRHLQLGLEAEPAAGAPVDVLVEVLEAFGRAEELPGRLERRAAAAAGEPERRAVSRARARVLERLGRTAEAAELYRALLTEAPDDVDLLGRLAELHRRESQPLEMIEPLERLLLIAEERSGDPQAAAMGLDPEALGLELAAVLAHSAGETERAEAVLRRLLARNPTSEALVALSDILLDRGAFDEADEALVRRAETEEDPSAVAVQLTERAQQRLGEPEGELAALGLLRRVPAQALPREGLLLRAELAEKVGDFGDALASLRPLVSGTDGDAALVRRFVGLATNPGVDLQLATSALEALATDRAEDPVVAEALFRLYGRLEDPRARNRAWTNLLGREHLLEPATRGRIYTALAEAAEQDGDLVRAEEDYRRALALDSDAALRALELVGHARVLVALKQVEEAEVDLEEALGLVPDHSAALLARAELAYKNQDWERARHLYTALAAAPAWDAVISGELLAFRRAELAEMFGDEAEAEAAYSEVARLNPRHVEAREALAQIALYRQDTAEAARRLSELLALYPVDALDKIREAREKLGQARFELGHDLEARHHLELVVAEDPERVGALETLVLVYRRLGMHREAAVVLGRLGRLHVDARARAEALFRQGEVLREALGDHAAANDAYLRSSDQDPGFVPTLLRLVHHYFEQGDFTNLLDMGAELERHGPELRADVAVRVALGALAVHNDAHAQKLWPRVLPADVAVEALVVLARGVRPSAQLAVKAGARLLREIGGPDAERDARDALARLRAEADPSQAAAFDTVAGALGG